MKKRAVLTASCCLLLCGCGPSLAGMPRIISRGGITPPPPAAARAVSEEARRQRQPAQALAAEEARLTHRQQALDERREVLARTQLTEISRAPQEQRRQPVEQAPTRQEQSQSEVAQTVQLGEETEPAPQQAQATDRLQYLRQMRVDIEMDQLQLDNERSALEQRRQVQASEPPSIVSEPDPASAPENFRDRFIRHVIAAQVNNPARADLDGMVDSGYLLVQTNCDDFFANAAVLQRELDISRDMIAPILGILTSILAIRNVSQADTHRLTQIFNLVSSTEIAGISIADKHFLFGAENIDDVRELTFRAFDAAEEHFASQGEPDFRAAVQQLIQYQLTCTPARILGLTQDAIAAGTVVADANAGPSHNELVLERLAQALGRPGALSAPQVLALWRLYRNGADPNNLPDGLDTLLASTSIGLGTLVIPHRVADATKNPPVTAAPAKLSPEGEAHRDRIYALLGTFTPTARARLREEAAKPIGSSTGNITWSSESGRGPAAEPFTLPTGTRRRARLRVQ